MNSEVIVLVDDDDDDDDDDEYQGCVTTGVCFSQTSVRLAENLAAARIVLRVRCPMQLNVKLYHPEDFPSVMCRVY